MPEVPKKKEKVPKIVNSAPIMLLEKPVVTDIDYFNIDLSWSQASLPPNSTPTSFTYVTTYNVVCLVLQSAPKVYRHFWTRKDTLVVVVVVVVVVVISSLITWIVSSGNAWERRSQSYFDSGNGVPRNAIIR